MQIKNIGWVYYPKGPKADDYVVPSGNQPDMVVVPTHVEAPKEVIAALQDAFAYWDENKEEKMPFSIKSEELFDAIKSTLDNNSVKLFQQQAKYPDYTMANSYNLTLLQSTVWPEILSAFRTLDMGDPKDFYDAIISAGFPLRKGSVGTLGELSPKPHPWLYSETCRVGLGIGSEDSAAVVGIEDSGAGICSIRLAGYPAIGIAGGNIEKSGTKGLCNYFCADFAEILGVLF